MTDTVHALLTLSQSTLDGISYAMMAICAVIIGYAIVTGKGYTDETKNQGRG